MDKEVEAIAKINEIFAEIKDSDDIERILEYFTDRYCFSYKSGRQSILRSVEYVLNKHCNTGTSESL